MEIRYATLRDVAAVAAVEAACFPPAEAATEAQFAERIRHYGNHFWLMFDGEKLVAFVDGFVTDEPDLTDGMYETASMHDETGAWQMIFGVNTLPAYRRFRCETAGAQGTCTDLQASPDPVLCAFRLCGRGCFGEIHPRERRVAPDAAVLLTAI